MSNITNKIQEKINNLYLDTFKIYNGGLGLSVPHIPRVSENYFKNQTIVIGQETNTWYKSGNDDCFDVFLENKDDISKTCLTDRYDHFISNYSQSYGGKFWAFNRMLYDSNVLEDKMISPDGLSHVWLNLFTVEACKCKKDSNGRPTKNKCLADSIIKIQGNLIYNLLNLLKPKLIIAVTGHTLDNYLFNTALNSSNHELLPIDKRGILNEYQLGKVVIQDVNNGLHGTTIIRSYHPSYFMARINSNRGLKEKLKANAIDSNVSNYYTQVLFDELRTVNEPISTV